MAGKSLFPKKGSKALTCIDKTLKNVRIIDGASKTIKFLSCAKIAVVAATAVIVAIQLISVIKNEMQ